MSDTLAVPSPSSVPQGTSMYENENENESVLFSEIKVSDFDKLVY